MSRKPPAFPESLHSQEFARAAKGSSYIVDVITPLFGGGVKPSENDEITPIRVSSIRGHLRFWWRATRGGSFKTADELAQAEAKIWGTTSEPSKVQIQVEVTRTGSADNWAGLAHGTHLGYVLFPFQANLARRIPAKKCMRNVQFRLKLDHPESIATDVQAALWAWVNFGGIGARTRRGCGAIFCRDFAPPSANTNQVADWLKANKAAFGLDEHHARPWPTLGTLRLKEQPEVPEHAWSIAVNLLHKFRQGEIGRNAGPEEAGLSCWPEADSLRALTGIAQRSHTGLQNLKSAPAFPRVSLGLPIIFHFKDREDPPDFEISPRLPTRANEPVDKWKDATRMASPLVLRPLAFGNGSKALPMIVRLLSPAPPGLKLRSEGLDKTYRLHGKEYISRPELATYTNSPMKGRSHKGSALIAFLALAQTEKFQEVG